MSVRSMLDPLLFTVLERDSTMGLNNASVVLKGESIVADNGWRLSDTKPIIFTGVGRVALPDIQIEGFEQYRERVKGILYVYSPTVDLTGVKFITISNHTLTGDYAVLFDFISVFHDNGIYRFMFGKESDLDG